MPSLAVLGTLLHARRLRLAATTPAALSSLSLALTLALLGCGAEGGTTPTPPESDANRLEITFAYSPGPNQNTPAMDLFQSSRDGRLTAPLIATRDMELQPRWSRDGSRLVFTRFLDTPVLAMGTPVTIATIWVANADGSQQRRLDVDPLAPTTVGLGTTFNNQTNGAWSPDGASIVFNRSVGSTGQSGLAIIGADGSGLRWLVQGGSSPSWSPDGRIAFNKAGSTWTIRPDGSGSAQLPTGGDIVSEPQWSHDGTRLVALRSVGNSSGTAYDVVVMRADGTDRRTIVTGGNNVSASWSPDGQFILYEHVDVADISAPVCTLHKVPSNGGASVNLTPGRGVGLCGGASWRPF